MCEDLNRSHLLFEGIHSCLAAPRAAVFIILKNVVLSHVFGAFEVF